VTRLLLVRHGKAAAGWYEHHDPGLDDTGRAQALAVGTVLASADPVPLVSSPLRRARETARSLEEAWGRDAAVLPAVGEIPSPIDDLATRGEWLASVMRGGWADVDATLQEWRTTLIDALLGAPGDLVVFTHFVAINVAVGAALGDDRVVVFAPDNCSVTTLDVVDGRLVLVSLGDEAATTVG
jgi:broad specificity phosphatase PhoE